MIDEDLHVLFFGVLQLPVGCLEKPPRLASHHLDVCGTQAQRRATTVHGGVTDADDQHALADLLDVLEGNRFEPVDADVYAFAVIAPRYFEVLAARCPRADEHCVELAAVEEFLHALDAVIQLQLDAHVDYVADLFVENLRRQAKTRNVGTHESAGRFERLEDRHVITERSKIIGDRQ